MAQNGDASAAEDLRIVPVDREIAQSLLSMLKDQGVRVDRLNELVSRDPVLLLEVVAAANSLKNVTGKGLLDGKGALLALGLERIRQVIAELVEVTPEYESDKALWLKILKQKCRKSAAVSSIIAQAVKPEVMLDSFTIGSLAFFGDLLGMATIGEPFVGYLDEGLRRSKLKYRLANDHKFQLEERACEYFTARALPEILVKSTGSRQPESFS